MKVLCLTGKEFVMSAKNLMGCVATIMLKMSSCVSARMAANKAMAAQILHFDIKPNNIFLDKSFYPKISDSGQAKLCSRTHSTISVPGARGTAGYIALEIWNRNFGEASHKSEVFSYGMLILKMAGGRQDINGEGSDSSDKYFPHFVYKQIAVDKNITEHDDMMVGLWCVRTIPSDRPVMSRVIEVLKGSLEQLSILPKPSIFSPVTPRNEEENCAPCYSVYV
ncbi:PR5-like receptor kinase [Neltuma alba]|uniref:PR5-like receptor kinase n=1 Tax=Neltuma alba TaxID=207710 RepID=UPI0010A40BF8|nr:PR5-like receptor kinase [Prosopis alba]